MHQAWRGFRKHLRWNLKELGPRRKWSHEDLEKKGWRKDKDGELVTQKGLRLAPWGSQVRRKNWKNKIMTFETMLWTHQLPTHGFKRHKFDLQEACAQDGQISKTRSQVVPVRHVGSQTTLIGAESEEVRTIWWRWWRWTNLSVPKEHRGVVLQMQQVYFILFIAILCWIGTSNNYMFLSRPCDGWGFAPTSAGINLVTLCGGFLLDLF